MFKEQIRLDAFKMPAFSSEGMDDVAVFNEMANFSGGSM